MANEHSIRVSARGEFGQLERGLKNLQKDLNSVLGEIDKGARRGGLFDETQLRALDLYKTRFKGTMNDLNREFEKQNSLIDELHRKKERASSEEQKRLQQEIQGREKSLDVLRRQIRAMEDLYQKRGKESEGYGSLPTASNGPSGGRSIPGMSSLLGMGKLALGMAGITGITSMAMEAYQKAFESQVTPMNLSQRIRGSYAGSAKDMWDNIGDIGRKDQMGYTSAESWAFMDQYSRQAGVLNPSQLESSLKFGRAYGLEASETAGALGSIRELGGTATPKQFADMVASSVGQSGMTPRILEVMQTSAGLLSQMNTTLKDTGAKQVLAYQTTLDTIGNRTGMMKLTGQQGANIIGGLGGIYSPTEGNNWKYMGMQALQRYNPKKYGNMGLFDLEMNFEDGLMNMDNLPAMAGYLKEKSGGNENVMKRMLQRWLQDGGYNATKRQVDDLYTATDGLSAFDKGKMDKVMENLDAGDGTAKYQERMGQLGQNILDVNSRFEKQMENFGQPLLGLVTELKEGVTNIFEEINGDGTTQEILDFIKEHWKELATAVGVLGVIKGITSVASAIGILGKVLGVKTPLPSKAPLPLMPWVATSAMVLSLGGSEDENIKKKREEELRNKRLSTVPMDDKAYKIAKEKLDHPEWYPNLPKEDKEHAQKVVKAYESEQKKNRDYALDGTKRLPIEAHLKEVGEKNQKITKDQLEGMQKYLKGFTTAGEQDITTMKTQGVKTLKELKAEGSTEVTKLRKEGDQSFGNMSKTTKTKMDEVAKTHKTWADGFKAMWDDFLKIVDHTFGDNGADSGLSKLSGSGKPVSSHVLDYKDQLAKAGAKYGINDTNLLMAIMQQESGGRGKDVMQSSESAGLPRNSLNAGQSIEQGVKYFAQALKKAGGDVSMALQAYNYGLGYIDYAKKNGGHSDKVAKDFQKIQQRVHGGSYGDENYVDHVMRYYPKSSSGEFFAGWQNRVTSTFGQKESFRSSAHGGLDIDGTQGDAVQALAGGKIKFITMDDGGKYDKDKKKNNNKGGTEIGIEMPNGETYFYSHLSKIDPKILDQWFNKKNKNIQVNAGDYIGNIGGDPGKPGSGSSTTGSHLHLGYMSKKGTYKDPVALMKALSGIGDSDVGRFEGVTKTVNVNVKLSGDGAEKLNTKTDNTLRKLITEVIRDYEAQKLLLNPSKR